jgi:hypothetical protein
VPIGEYCVTRPHRSDVLRTIGVVQEDTTVIAVSVDAVVVAGVVGVGNVNGRVDNTVIILAQSLMHMVLLTTYGM